MGEKYNDDFQLLLNGANIAKLTNGRNVAINNLGASSRDMYVSFLVFSVLFYEPQVRACAHMQVFMEYRLHRQPWASSLRRFVGIHGVNYQYLRRQNIPMKAMNDGNERKNDGMARQPLPPRASHSSAEVVSFEPSSGCGNRGRGNCRRPLHDPGGGSRRP